MQSPRPSKDTYEPGGGRWKRGVKSEGPTTPSGRIGDLALAAPARRQASMYPAGEPCWECAAAASLVPTASRRPGAARGDLGGRPQAAGCNGAVDLPL